MEKKETLEEEKMEIEEGTKDEDVYSEGGREEMQENDEISPGEEGFSEGAEGDEQKGIEGDCPTCREPLGDREEGIVEREINGVKMKFCCEKCAVEYESKVKPDNRGE